MLQKLTLLIISYNRHKLLLRAIKYWSNFDVKVVILDGSNVALKYSNLNYKNIRYIHDPRSLNERLFNSSNYIETDFMILGTDDDFYLPSALCSCVKFLSHEKDFSSCGGCSIGFNVTKSKKIFGKEYYQKLKYLSLNNCSALSRIKKHFSNYVPAHVYSVIRSDVWKIISKYIFSGENYFFSDDELQIEFLTLVAGKSKILPELMWMRNLGQQAVRNSNNFKKLNFLDSWWFDKSKSNEKKFFLNRIYLACRELSPNSIKLNEKDIKCWLEHHAKNRSYFKHLTQKYNVLYFLNNYYEDIINRMTNFLNIKKKQDTNIFNVVNKLKSENIIVNNEDLNYLISFLENE